METKCLGPGGLTEKLGESRGRRQLGRGQDGGIGEGAGQGRTGLVGIAAEQGDAGHRQQRRDAGPVLRQLARPAIVGGGQIALLESDFGGQGLNRGQLTVLREEPLGDLGSFVQFAQLEEGASEAGAGAGRGIAGEATLPAGADAGGVARREGEGGTLVQEGGRLACLLLDQVQQRRGVVEPTADAEPRHKLVAELCRQRDRFGEGDLWFKKGHRGAVAGARGRLAGALHARSPGRD